MCTPSVTAPPAPDYTGAAQEQAAASKDLATATTWANRPQLNTPWGQQTWSAASDIDPSTGAPITKWTSNINLTPAEQQALDSQQRIQQGRSDAAQQLLGQATSATATPFDWSKMPTAPGQAAQAGNMQDAQNQAFQQMSAMLQPGRTQQQAALDTKLANMGLSRDSEAYRRANADLSNQWAQEDKGVLAQSMAEGRASQGQQYQQAQSTVAQQEQLRQQAIAEEAQRRGMPLNEMTALLTGQQVGMPQMPSFQTATSGQAPQLLDAAIAQGQYGLNAAQLNQANQPNIGGLLGSVAGSFFGPMGTAIGGAIGGQAGK